MRSPALDERRQRLVADERALVARISQVLLRLDVPLPSQEALRQSAAQLDDLFLLVIVGEFNVGKSALINVLLGQRVLEEGVTPTTSRVAVLRFGPTVTREPTPDGFDVVTALVDLLRDLKIVDTPGTNAVIREHEALTREFVPRADLVLFVTSADRPFTESERTFLEAVRHWGKPVLIAVNKMDLLATPADREQLLDFVRTHATALLDRIPEVFPLSARQAAQAPSSEPATALHASGVSALTAFIEQTLDDEERFRLKLRNPLGVGRRVVDEATSLVDARLDLLRDDVGAVESLDEQLRLHREDVTRDMRFRLADIDKELLDFEKRGHAFFEEMLRLGRVPDLINRHKVAALFEHDVVADLPDRIAQRVEAVVDWMAEGEHRLWRGISAQLERREAAHADRLAGRITGPFESNRTRIRDEVRRESQRAVESYDERAEARRLADQIREAVTGAALLQAGAVGLGTVVTALASTTAADVTGLLAAGVLSVLGFLVLPARRRKARRDLDARVSRLRELLMTTLSAKTTQELDASVRRIDEAMTPYTRFVRAESARLSGIRDELNSLARELDAIRARVDAL